MPSRHAFQWSTVDETTDGRVQFVTMVDIDAPTPAHVSQDAWGRMLCFYVIGHLHGKALIEACQALADIYSWQIEKTHPVPQIQESKRRPVTGVRQVERIPFALDED
jgi:hypothetical protein